VVAVVVVVVAIVVAENPVFYFPNNSLCSLHLFGWDRYLLLLQLLLFLPLPVPCCFSQVVPIILTAHSTNIHDGLNIRKFNMLLENIIPFSKSHILNNTLNIIIFNVYVMKPSVLRY
jgi:hypothetical protein